MEERKGKKTIIFEEILLALIPTKNQYFLPIKSTKLLTTPPKICIITFAIKYCAAMAQSVERILGKDEVTGSIPVSSSKNPECDSIQDFYLLPLTSSLLPKIVFRIFGEVISKT